MRINSIIRCSAVHTTEHASVLLQDRRSCTIQTHRQKLQEQKRTATVGTSAHGAKETCWIVCSRLCQRQTIHRLHSDRVRHPDMLIMHHRITDTLRPEHSRTKDSFSDITTQHMRSKCSTLKNGGATVGIESTVC